MYIVCYVCITGRKHANAEYTFKYLTAYYPEQTIFFCKKNPSFFYTQPTKIVAGPPELSN